MRLAILVCFLLSACVSSGSSERSPAASEQQPSPAGAESGEQSEDAPEREASRGIALDDIYLPPEQALDWLALPVASAPIELLVQSVGEPLRSVDLATQTSTEIRDANGYVSAFFSDGSMWIYQRRTLDLLEVERRELATGEVSTLRPPRGSSLRGVTVLEGEAVAVETYVSGTSDLWVYVFEASGDLRCVFEPRGREVTEPTSDGHLTVEERNGDYDVTAVFALDSQNCQKAAELPLRTRLGVRFGDEGNVIVEVQRGEDIDRLVRHELIDGLWTEVLAGANNQNLGVLHFAYGSIWTATSAGVYRISPETLMVEASWPSVEGCQNRTVLPKFTQDAVWAISGCSNELLRIDAKTESMERYPLPVDEVSPSAQVSDHGLLIGQPDSGYLFNFEAARFERLPDWAFLDVADQSSWSIRPPS